MIHHIKGKLIEKNPSAIIIECNGVGYFVNISLNTYSNISDSETCMLYTHFVVREDSQQLFGFADKAERHIFRQLVSVSGVGANTARVILSSLSPDEIKQAIVSGSVAVLKNVKGIGAKTAQRIIVDLADKIGKEGLTDEKSFSANNTMKQEALSALSGLGIDKAKTEKVVERILVSNPTILLEELVKAALKTM